MGKDRLGIELDCNHVQEPGAICLDCFYNVVDQLEAQLRVERDEVKRLEAQYVADGKHIQSAETEIDRLRGDLVAQDEVHQAWMTMAKEHIEQSVQGERELRATIATLREALEKTRQPHLIVDGDCWFSCPKSDECCDDSRDKNVCDCGADAHNERLDKALATAQEE